jgi:D-glycero-D-manno-heptose 1,7-bisphosphate phosphatase
VKRAVFLDRDGVLNRYYYDSELGVLTTPFSERNFELLPGVDEAVAQLNRMGFLTVVASNQPGIAKGYFDLSVLGEMDKKLKRQLQNKEAKLDAIYYCLHHPREGNRKYKRNCNCRKPKPGLLLQAAEALNLSLKDSYMVGDSITDVEAGQRADCKTILIHKYKCDLCQFMEAKGIKPDFIVENLTEAVKIISRQEERNGNLHRQRRLK